ncbi:hypothetical protein FRC01_005998 [Tulasnella sp. 417]|nr:hypothetical protein FRC01_005998 [Tulasnella sp. 417]
MAKKFPHANVLGSDVVLPGHPEESVPSNCHFEFLDVNKDMGKLQEIYDVVHWRLVESSTVDADQFFYDVARVLRPGGVFIAVAGDPRLLDETGTVVPLKREGDPQYSHFQHLLKRLADHQFAEGPPRLLHGLWDQMYGSNPNFKDFRLQEFLLPTGPWEEGMSQRREIAEMMAENMLRIVRSWADSVRSHGKYPREEINRLEEGALQEFRDFPPGVRAYQKWIFATAVRTDSAWSARTQPWKLPEWFSTADHIIPSLPEDS